MQKASALDPDLDWAEIALHLVDDTGIQMAHQDYFGLPTVTDVISQHYDPFPGESGSAGELIVNVEQATRARKAKYWSVNKELALYIAHGIDHLYGSNDSTPEERQTMRRRELRWLQQIERDGFAFHKLNSKRP